MKCKSVPGRSLEHITQETTLLCGKGIMRIIFTAGHSLATTSYDQTLQRLVGILGVTSKNPSNPNFDQYLFESLSGLMRQVKGREDSLCSRLTRSYRFVAAANPATVPTFERQLFGPFTFILQQDIDRER